MNSFIVLFVVSMAASYVIYIMPKCKTQHCCSKNLEAERKKEEQRGNCRLLGRKTLQIEKSFERFEVVIYLNCSSISVHTYENSVM